MGWVVNAMPGRFNPGNGLLSSVIRGWVGPRAALDGCGKSRLTGIRTPVRPERSESLCRLSYLGLPRPTKKRSKLRRDNSGKKTITCTKNEVTTRTILFKLRRSVHSLISLYISVPHTSQSQSTLYNHWCTHLPLPLPLLFLPVCGRLMAVLLLYMFSSTVGKSKCQYALPEMLHLYNVGNPATSELNFAGRWDRAL